MPDRLGGVRGIVLVPQLSEDQIKEILLTDIAEAMEESKEILNEQEEAMLDQSKNILMSIIDGIEPEEVEIEFQCTECGIVRTGYVTDDQMPDNTLVRLKTRHDCEECDKETVWERAGVTRIDIE